MVNFLLITILLAFIVIVLSLLFNSQYRSEGMLKSSRRTTSGKSLSSKQSLVPEFYERIDDIKKSFRIIRTTDSIQDFSKHVKNIDDTMAWILQFERRGWNLHFGNKITKSREAVYRSINNHSLRLGILLINNWQQEISLPRKRKVPSTVKFFKGIDQCILLLRKADNYESVSRKLNALRNEVEDKFADF